jgi:hypothetical protein
MHMLELLARLDGPPRFPLTKPYLAIQPDPTRHDVDVIFVCVLVAHGHPRRIALVKTHALHEISRDGFPFLGTQAFAGRQ